ncbi:MAG: glutamate--tRNA ligase [Bacteroidota bacterium]
MSSRRVRVRFAPSPTGPLHIGGVRTALFNYLHARQAGGDFVLRIEDTDQTRFVPGAEEYIQEALKWCGMEPDESPKHGGEYGPYRQSERKGMYREYADRLLAEGKAYYAFDTSEELDQMRERLKAARVAAPQYNAVTRMQMKNSITLPEDEVKARLESGEPYVIRFKMPRKEEVRLNDIVRGWVMVHSSTLDDKILLKSDGMPTYHLANVVDDYLMKITHVIRGEEWLPSAPLHVLLYKAFGWEDVMPQFAHLPLLLRPDGNGKLSKRDGDRLGFPVFPLDWKNEATGETAMGYREQGYLHDAFVNMLAMLGWSPGTNEEIFSIEELIEKFSLSRINKAGTKFSIDKVKWYNQEYLRSRSNTELAAYYVERAKAEGIDVEPTFAEKTVNLSKERATFLDEIWEDGKYFATTPSEYDEKVVKKKWTLEATQGLQHFVDLLKAEEGEFDASASKQALSEKLSAEGIKIGKVMQPLRLSVSGVGVGAELMDVLQVLGRDEVVKRIETALESLKDRVKMPAA